MMMKKILIAGFLLSALFISGCFFNGPCIQGYGSVISEIRELDDFTAVSNTFEYEVRVSQSDTFGVEVEAQENLHNFIETYVSGSTLIVKTKNGTCINSAVPVIIYVSMPYVEEIRNTGSGNLSADIADVVDFEISNTGSGTIMIDSIFATTVMLKNTGSGELYVSASYPDEIDVVQTGSGMIDAGIIDRPLEVNINHTSSGKIYGSIIEGLVVNARLTGSGQVLLDGEAEFADLNVSSSGKIDAMEMIVFDAEVKNTGSGKVFVYATETLKAIINGSGDVYYRGNPQVSVSGSGSGSLRPY